MLNLGSSLKSNGAAATGQLRVPIITYHSIDESGSIVSTRLEVFRRQIKFLGDNGYKAITLRDLMMSIKRHEAIGSNTVVLTFDDGFRNFYTDAFPVLREHNFKATVFLVTDACGKHNDWAGNPPLLGRRELLSWNEIKELHEFGIEFGSHSKTHPDLTQIDVARARLEIKGSKDALSQKLGVDPASIAYPFGRFNRTIKQIAADHYDGGCTTNLGKVSAHSDFLSLERIDSYYLSNQRFFETLQSSSFDNYLRFRQALRTVRSLGTRMLPLRVLN